MTHNHIVFDLHVIQRTQRSMMSTALDITVIFKGKTANPAQIRFCAGVYF